MEPPDASARRSVHSRVVGLHANRFDICSTLGRLPDCHMCLACVPIADEMGEKKKAALHTACSVQAKNSPARCLARYFPPSLPRPCPSSPTPQCLTHLPSMLCILFVSYYKLVAEQLLTDLRSGHRPARRPWGPLSAPASGLLVQLQVQDMDHLGLLFQPKYFNCPQPRLKTLDSTAVARLRRLQHFSVYILTTQQPTPKQGWKGGMGSHPRRYSNDIQKY